MRGLEAMQGRGTNFSGPRGIRWPRLICGLALAALLAAAGADSSLAQSSAQQPGGAAQLPAAGDESMATILHKLLPDQTGEPLVYRAEGRPDPFMPFVTEARVKAEQASEQEQLSGMQLFEPGQLTLVAIVRVGKKESLAMAQDSAGKGYVLRKGMLIGRRGIIKEILPDMVLVNELVSYNTRTKQKTYKTSKMVLKKEGGNE